MTHILNGVIKFGRTVKTGDFENKRCDVELSFGTEEGKQVEEAALDNIGKLARRKVHELLEMQKPTEQTPEFLAPKTGNDKDKLAAQVTGEEAPKKPAGRPRKPPAAPQPEVDPAAMVDESAAAPVADPAAMDDDLLSAAAVEVTDEDLTGAITRRNATIKNAPGIRALIGKYVLPPKQARDIPQEARAKFMEELAKLGPPATA